MSRNLTLTEPAEEPESFSAPVLVGRLLVGLRWMGQAILRSRLLGGELNIANPYFSGNMV